jgi:hypothetical protein
VRVDALSGLNLENAPPRTQAFEAVKKSKGHHQGTEPPSQKILVFNLRAFVSPWLNQFLHSFFSLGCDRAALRAFPGSKPPALPGY